jgi:hypothetical protein
MPLKGKSAPAAPVSAWIVAIEPACPYTILMNNSPTAQKSASPTRRIAGWVAACAVAFALLPLVAFGIASALAAIGDCEANESQVMPCVIAGIDFGEVVSLLFMSMWLLLLTGPIGFGIAIVAAIVWVVSKARAVVRARREARQ